jgi:hypothetical protein
MTESAEEKLPISDFYKVVDHVTLFKSQNGGRQWSSSNPTAKGQSAYTSGKKDKTHGKENTNST